MAGSTSKPLETRLRDMAVQMKCKIPFEVVRESQLIRFVSNGKIELPDIRFLDIFEKEQQYYVSGLAVPIIHIKSRFIVGELCVM